MAEPFRALVSSALNRDCVRVRTKWFASLFGTVRGGKRGRFRPLHIHVRVLDTRVNAVVLTLHFNLPPILHGATRRRQVRVLGPAQQHLAIVGLGRDERQPGDGDVTLGVSLKKNE